MLEFIKMFGMGIFYTIVSPIVLAFFVLFLIYSFFNYLVCEIINLSGFFLGKKFKAQTQLDKEYLKIKKEREDAMFAVNHVNLTEDGDFNV